MCFLCTFGHALESFTSVCICVCERVHVYVLVCVRVRVCFSFEVFLRLGEQVNWVKMCSGGMPQIDKYMEISGVCRCQTPGCVQLHSCLCVGVYVCVYMCYFCLREDNKEKCKSVVKRMCDGGTGHVNVVVRWLVCVSVHVCMCVCARL